MYSLPVSGGQKALPGSHWAEIKASAGLSSCWNLVSFLDSWPLPPSSTSAAASPVFLMVSLWPPLLPPSSTFKDPCDYIEPIWTIQINLPTSRSTTLITSARRHYYHVSWHSLRSQFQRLECTHAYWTIVLPHIVVSLEHPSCFQFWCTMDCGTRFHPTRPSQWFLEITEPGT